MNIYTVEISAYPQEFTIAAATEGAAKMEAQHRWHDKHGGNIYETKVTNKEEFYSAKIDY